MQDILLVSQPAVQGLLFLAGNNFHTGSSKVPQPPMPPTSRKWETDKTFTHELAGRGEVTKLNPMDEKTEATGDRVIQRLQKNHRERQRRQSINSKYEELTRILGTEGLNKAKILGEAINRVQTLRAKLAIVEGQYRDSLVPVKRRKILESGQMYVVESCARGQVAGLEPLESKGNSTESLCTKYEDTDKRKVRKNSRERRRRLSINVRFEMLTELLVPRPDLVKWNKAYCLGRVIAEIKTLQGKLDKAVSKQKAK